MLSKQLLKHLHCGSQGERWEKCISFNFKEFFHLHVIFGSVTFIEDLNNTFQHRPVK